MENKAKQTNLYPTTRPFKDILFSVAEFNRRMRSDVRFRTFARQVYEYLDKMKTGHYLRLNRYEGEKLEWIVLTAAAFIAEGLHSLEYCFSDDFSRIEHYRVDPRFLRKMKRIKYGEYI